MVKKCEELFSGELHLQLDLQQQLMDLKVSKFYTAFTLAFIIRASTVTKGQHSSILQCKCEPNHAGQTGPAWFLLLSETCLKDHLCNKTTSI